jgi:hypothetical protein
MLMAILLISLFILFVLMLLAALVYSWAKLTKDARTPEDVPTGEDRQQPILKASVLHLVLKAGR